MTITKHVLLIVGALFLGSILPAQTNINLSPSTIDFNTDCVEVLVGSTVDFTSSSDCGGTSAITTDRGVSVVFSTEKTSFNYAFEDLGEFTLLCNLGATNSGSATVCINVVESLSNLSPGPSMGVPTMGEWGIVCLMLVLMICSTLTLTQMKSEQSQLC